LRIKNHIGDAVHHWIQQITDFTIISRLASSKGIKTWTRIDRLFNDINGSNPELEEPTYYTCTSGAVTGFYCWNVL